MLIVNTAEIKNVRVLANMNISSARTRTPKKRLLFIIILAALILIAGTVIYFALQRRMEDSLKVTQPSDSAKNDIINSDKDNTSVPNEGLPDNPTGITQDDVPTSTTLSVSISSTSQSNGLVQSTAATNGNGTCVFLYQPADGGKPVTRQVSVVESSCSTSISQNEFAYLGEWKLTVTYYKDSNKTEVSQSVTIN